MLVDFPNLVLVSKDVSLGAIIKCVFRADHRFLNLNYSGSIVLEVLNYSVLRKIPNTKNATGYFDIA